MLATDYFPPILVDVSHRMCVMMLLHYCEDLLKSLLRWPKYEATPSKLELEKLRTISYNRLL
jgi:hypothetical protein